MSFASNPEGATVTVSGVIVGTTPITVNMLRKEGQSVLFEKDGYKPMSMALETKMNGWFWGNIICGGLLGSTTDGMSGAAYKYAPSNYLVTMEPTSVSVPIEHATDMSNDQKIREFVVISYRQLTDDIKAGKGEYLESIFSLLKTPAAERDGDLAQLRVLAASYTAIPDFADHVCRLAREK